MITPSPVRHDQVDAAVHVHGNGGRCSRSCQPKRRSNFFFSFFLYFLKTIFIIIFNCKRYCVVELVPLIRMHILSVRLI